MKIGPDQCSVNLKIQSLHIGTLINMMFMYYQTMKNYLSPSDRESVWISRCDIFTDAYKILLLITSLLLNFYAFSTCIINIGLINKLIYMIIIFFSDKFLYT